MTAEHMRVLEALLHLAESSMSAAGDALLKPPPTITDIALRASVTREAVGGALHEMVPAGVVEMRGRALFIPSVERLRQMLAAGD